MCYTKCQYENSMGECTTSENCPAQYADETIKRCLELRKEHLKARLSRLKDGDGYSSMCELCNRTHKVEEEINRIDNTIRYMYGGN